MNPTSPGTRSPRYTLSPITSPSTQGLESEPTSLSTQEQWSAEGTCLFPIYSDQENLQFKQTFYHHVKKISLQLQSMMAYLSEISPDTVTTPWQAFSTLVSCLGNNLPAKIPLSIFTSSVAVVCIANAEHAPPAKKRKSSDPFYEFAIQNKLLEAAEELAKTISSTLSFLKLGVQLNQLKEKNPGSHQSHRAFQHTIFKRLAVECSDTFDLAQQDLSDRIASAIDPLWDSCSSEAKDQLLRSATNALIRKQDALISDVYIGLAHQHRLLPLTGKNLLTICKKHSASPINVSENMEGWPSWEDRIFCLLAQSFLQKNNVVLPQYIDSQLLFNMLESYAFAFPKFPSPAFSLSEKKACVLATLAEHFSSFHVDRFGTQTIHIFELSTRYNEFLHCSTSIANLLKGFFTLENSMCFSQKNLSKFQQYTQTLHLPNTTVATSNATQEAASMCSEEHQMAFSCTRLLLEETTKLLKQFMSQSLALVVARNQRYTNKHPQDITPCEWMPDELRLSKLFCNLWEEAVWERSSGLPLGKNLPIVNKQLALMLKNTSTTLRKTFQKFCHNLLMDVLAEMPLEQHENALRCFFSQACTIQAKMIPKYGQTSKLFTIGINFITKLERMYVQNIFLTNARESFEEEQKAYIAYTYDFIIQHETFIPATKEEFLKYCKEQYKGNVIFPVHLEKLPFWNDYIFLYLAHIFLQKQNKPVTAFGNVTDGAKALQKHFSRNISRIMPISDRRDRLMKAMAEMLLLRKQEPISTAKSPKIMYDNTACETFLESLTAFNKLIPALFKLDTGKNLSLKNLRAFQKYTNDLLLSTEDTQTKEMLLGWFAIHLEEPQSLDAVQTKISDTLTIISILLKKLTTEALTLLVLTKQTAFRSFTPKVAILSAFRSTGFDSCVPYTLLLSQEIQLCWEEAIQCPPEEDLLSSISNHFERTSKAYNETASELTQYFLQLCQILLVEISKELFLTSAPEKVFQTKKDQFATTASTIYPKPIVDPFGRQSILFKEIVNFLAVDKFSTEAIQCLTLATEHFLKAQQSFTLTTYAHLIKHKLPLPLTAKDLLVFCKKQYGSTASIPLSLLTLPSWHNYILYALAHVFLLSKGHKTAPDFHPWNPSRIINSIVPFFHEEAKKTLPLPQRTQIEEFTKHLIQYFNSYGSLATHDTAPCTTDPYTCNIYEKFLKSESILKTYFRTLFQLETGNNCSSQTIEEFKEYTAKLLANEPALRRTSALQDVAILCSENNDTLEQKQIWTDLNHANTLIKTFMELSLALILFSGTMDPELPPQQIVNLAFQNVSPTKLLPLELEPLPNAFISSLAGTQALQSATNAYLSGALCLQFFEPTRRLLEGIETNPLQAAIDAHVSGHSSSKSNEHKDLLSSLFLSTKKELENVCKTLYTDLKADVMPAISKEPSIETPSQKFITTANKCHKKMMDEQQSEIPLFDSLVFLLAQDYEYELQKRPSAASDQFMRIQLETPATLEDANTSMWKNIIGVLLEEEQQAIQDKENQSAILQTPETEEALSELLQAEDFTDFLEQTVDFTDLLEQTVDFTDLLEQEFQFEEEPEEDAAS